MTWRGAETRFPLLYKGQPIDPNIFPLPVVGRYVLTCDTIAARLYQRSPYNFPLVSRVEDDNAMMFSRADFLRFFESAFAGARRPTLRNALDATVRKSALYGEPFQFMPRMKADFANPRCSWIFN